MHHRFDDSPDDYEMDMDQRTRMLGRGGRIILLGDGTEIVTGNGEGDVEMNEGGRVMEEEDSDDMDDKDLEELLRNKREEKGLPNGEDRNAREGTPAPAASEGSGTGSASTDAKPEDPKTTQAADK
jgi:protein phosphatase 2C family protein 2/3